MKTAASGEGPTDDPRPGRGRRKRSTDEVRALILSAARDLFARRGYPATTTRDIAVEAGVNEAMIYRHFGSKSQLFETAVGEAFRMFLEEFTSEWTRESDGPRRGRDAVADFVEGLYDTMSKNKELILAYIFARQYDLTAAGGSGVESIISRALQSIDEFTKDQADRLNFHGLDVHLTLRCSVALVMGIALHDELLFGPERDHPSRTRLLREAVTYVHHAIGTRRVHLDD